MLVLLALFAASLSAVFSGSAMAGVAAPGWQISALAEPTNLPPGGEGTIDITLYNTGAAASTAGATVTDTLPVGVTAVSQSAFGFNNERQEWVCTGGTPVTCTTSAPELPAGSSFSNPARLKVSVAPGATGVVMNHLRVDGGGAASPTTVNEAVTIDLTQAGFGIASWDGWFSNADGTVDTQAGSHPYEASFALALNNYVRNGIVRVAGDLIRNVITDLPPGLVGDPGAAPQCPRRKFDSAFAEPECPPASQIGVAKVTAGGGGVATLPIYNLVPPPGVPAQFGFGFFGIEVFLDASVRSGGDYGIRESIRNIPQSFITATVLTLWGTPADASHNAERCTVVEGSNLCGLESDGGSKPFLTLPTACEAPLKTAVQIDAWESASTAQSSFEWHDTEGTPQGITGCEHLSFGPSISVAPDTTYADTPAGLIVHVRVPQEALSNAKAVASADIKDTKVTLPEGLVINPGQANGLAACQPGEDGLGQEGPASCPAASRVGTDRISTPLLADKLEGDVYVLQSNPPNLKLLVTAYADGVYLKLVGNVHLDESTGRLTTTFENTPQLPFTDFELAFSGGAQAALATPTTCGQYATAADFTPWSTPFTADLLESSSFAIERGTGGGACASPLPFSPSLTAGATTDQAGGYTSFSLLLQRADDQQRVSTLQFKTPEGLLGMISKVPLCGEPAASQGACPTTSQIGHTIVAAGPGPYPLVVPEPGQPPAPIYLTGGYKGAPYGLSIAVPVIAGPFNLGTVVVRAAIAVDPHTAQLTVTTDPLPSILDGIPTDLRTVNAVIDRPGFMFNPTDCDPMSFSGIATSTEGTQAPIASHFQVGSCQSLTFKPNFKVSTAGRSSRKNGASLDAKIIYPTGALGANQASSQSNIASVKVDLPKQLPSRLTTLQKACTAAVFDANPAGCPRASVVGHATAVTPVLPVALTGPAYFVSRGGEAFPQLIAVLQGYGVTVDLVGDTFISKAGITSSTFKQVPDVPIASFELTLPQGPFSALAANLPAKAKGSFCGQSLTMPTAFTGHNGAVIHQSTKITISGCAKPKKKHKPKAKKTARGQGVRKRA